MSHFSRIMQSVENGTFVVSKVSDGSDILVFPSIAERDALHLGNCLDHAQPLNYVMGTFYVADIEQWSMVLGDFDLYVMDSVDNGSLHPSNEVTRLMVSTVNGIECAK